MGKVFDVQFSVFSKSNGDLRVLGIGLQVYRHRPLVTHTARAKTARTSRSRYLALCKSSQKCLPASELSGFLPALEDPNLASPELA
jgi:hypothetical protein